MIKWIFNDIYLEGNQILFFVGLGIIFIIFIITFILIHSELKRSKC